MKSAGIEKARLYLDANQNAIEKYAGLCRDMDCDFERKTAYIYSLDNRKRLEDEAEALYKMGFPAKITETGELPFPTVGALSFEAQAQFHPLKFISRTARDLKIYEHTFVKELKAHTAVTDNGIITFRKLIITTHFPIDNKHGMYFLKMYQHRSYVTALRNAAKMNGMYLDEAKEECPSGATEISCWLAEEATGQEKLAETGRRFVIFKNNIILWQRKLISGQHRTV